MKLLYDQNLSPKLVSRLGEQFPDSKHVREVGLASAKDPSIWAFAKDNGFTIVSKDEDFHHLSFLRGAPPKVIGIHTGNASTTIIADLLRTQYSRILAFGADPDSSFLALP